MKVSTSANHIRLSLLYLARAGYYHQVGRSEGLADTTAMVYLHCTYLCFIPADGSKVHYLFALIS